MPQPIQPSNPTEPSLEFKVADILKKREDWEQLAAGCGESFETEGGVQVVCSLRAHDGPHCGDMIVVLKGGRLQHLMVVWS